jgi:hypothetical protein
VAAEKENEIGTIRTKRKERVKGQRDLITSLILYFEAVALATMLSFALAYQRRACGKSNGRTTRRAMGYF